MTYKFIVKAYRCEHVSDEFVIEHDIEELRTSKLNSDLIAEKKLYIEVYYKVM